MVAAQYARISWTSLSTLGYTAHNRLLAFCFWPARQVTGWGYATGVGWEAMDGDAGIASSRLSGMSIERLVYLTCGRLAHRDPEAESVAVADQPTFGVFNAR
jgi:hypothetical protein